MASQAEIRRQITDRIVEALQRGTPPWRRPWAFQLNAGSPANAISKRRYSGVNPLLLELAAGERGFRSRWWGTYKQWSDLGFRIKPRPAHVRPGEWGTRVVFCKPVSKAVERDQADEDHEGQPGKREERFLLLRQFVVFNAEQVQGEGIQRFLARPHPTTSFVEFGPADEVISATKARIEFAGGKAMYVPDEDYIRLPLKRAFESPKEYYATAFHELGHWSGHETRLNRLVKNARFASRAYSFEELVAEMCGCFLGNEVGLPQSDDLSNQAAYLASWLTLLQADPTAIFTAASQASVATDFLLTFSRRGKEAAAEESEAAVCVTA